MQCLHMFGGGTVLICFFCFFFFLFCKGATPSRGPAVVFEVTLMERAGSNKEIYEREKQEPATRLPTFVDALPLQLLCLYSHCTLFMYLFLLPSLTPFPHHMCYQPCRLRFAFIVFFIILSTLLILEKVHDEGRVKTTSTCTPRTHLVFHTHTHMKTRSSSVAHVS